MKGNIRQTSDRDLPTALDYARFYLPKGLSVIPVIKHTKKPALPSWKEFQERRRMKN